MFEFLRKRKLSSESLFTLKLAIKHFFEGDKETKRDPVIDIPIERFQINGIETVLLRDGTIELTIYMVRPGLMIGKRGDVIRKLGGYLSTIMEAKVKVCARERDIWSK